MRQERVTRIMDPVRFGRPLLAAVLLVLSGGFCGVQAQNVTGLNPVEVAADKLRPGLAVRYFFQDFKHVDAMPTGAAIAKDGRLGKPILQLHQRSSKGALFDSGANELFGMHITGLIRLERAGDYVFVAKSNDGVRVQLGDKRIIDDPEVHADRFSIPTTVKIVKPGWYPLTVQYFQRKFTAALELHWQAPGENEFSPVPAEVFRHVPDGATK